VETSDQLRIRVECPWEFAFDDTDVQELGSKHPASAAGYAHRAVAARQ
jgi:hypothetical protein